MNSSSINRLSPPPSPHLTASNVGNNQAASLDNNVRVPTPATTLSGHLGVLARNSDGASTGAAAGNRFASPDGSLEELAVSMQRLAIRDPGIPMENDVQVTHKVWEPAVVARAAAWIPELMYKGLSADQAVEKSARVHKLTSPADLNALRARADHLVSSGYPNHRN